MLYILILQTTPQLHLGINSLVTMTCSISFLAMLVSLTVSAWAIEEISAAPSCNDVTKELTPCLGFLKGNGAADSPSSACCAGAKLIADQAKSFHDKIALCECLKGVLANVGSYDPSRVPLVANKCSINVFIPPITGTTTDCSKALIPFPSHFS